MRLDLARIQLARTQINPVFLDTPQYECEPLGEALGCRLFLKIKTMNPSARSKAEEPRPFSSVFKKEGPKMPLSARARGILVRRSHSAGGRSESESRWSHRQQQTR